jgi:spore maturation protein CgeB
MSLRVGVVGSLVEDSFADNILSAFAQMGHEPVVLGPAVPQGGPTATASAWTFLSRFVTIAETYQRRLVATAVRREVDVVVSTHAALSPSAVASLKSTGCKVAFWFPDSVANLDRQLMLAADYDALFFKDPRLVERLRNLSDAPVHYLPEACNPAWHQSQERTKVHPVVVVAGNLYLSRVLLLERLHRAGVPLALYGPGFPRWVRGFEVQRLPVLPHVYRHEKARVFRTAAAVLNNLHPAEMDSVNCRLFEAAGCGAVVLCEDRPVLAQVFEPNQEVLTFATFDELMDHIHAVLKDPDRATRIGDAAARKAHAAHTYQHRLTELLRTLGLNP